MTARPRTASVVRDISRYTWGDDLWMATRKSQGAWLDRPMAIYEAHLVKGEWTTPTMANTVSSLRQDQY